MNSKSWQGNLVAPIGIILCMVIMISTGNCKMVDVVCGIIIGMQIMLIMDFLIDRFKIKEKKIY